MRGLDATASRAPSTFPTRIRIAGSGVIDKPTFRLTDARVFGSGEAPHSPQDGENASRMP